MGLIYKYNGTIRKAIEDYYKWYNKTYPKAYSKDKQKPLAEGIWGCEGIKVYACKNKGVNSSEEVKFIGEEIFSLTDKTFLTDPLLLKYVDKPALAYSSAGGIGIDGKGGRRRWVGIAYYVYSPEDFE